MNLLLRVFHGFVDRISRWSFSVSSFLLIVLVFLVVEQVISRYFFNSSQVALQELEWHLFGFIITLSIAHTLKENRHVRVDVVSCSFSRLVRRGVHIVGFLLLIPLCLTLAYFGFLDVLQARSFASSVPEDFYTQILFPGEIKTFFKLVSQSIEIILREFILVGEGSSDAGGLEARWIIKSAFPVAMTLLALQSLSLLIRCFQPSTRENEKYSWL